MNKIEINRREIGKIVKVLPTGWEGKVIGVKDEETFLVEGPYGVVDVNIFDVRELNNYGR